VACEQTLSYARQRKLGCVLLFIRRLAKLNFDISFWRINIFTRGSASWRDEALLITRGFSGY